MPAPAPSGRPPARYGSRSKARKRALDILFESEARGDDALEVLARRVAGTDAPPVSDFAVTLVEGVVAHRDHLDAVIGETARGWTVDRMPAVDRAVLRIGAFEILFSDEVPDAVAIDEAIDLARRLSTDDSPRFVNGVLAGLASGTPVAVAPPVRDRTAVPADAHPADDGPGPDPAPEDPVRDEESLDGDLAPADEQASGDDGPLPEDGVREDRIPEDRDQDDQPLTGPRD